VNIAWMVLIQGGQAVRVWSQDAQMQAMLGQCVGEQGSIKKGAPGVCGNAKNMIMKSYLPGCISKTPDPLFEGESGPGDSSRCGEAE
jgi:hypothetical protein